MTTRRETLMGYSGSNGQKKYRFYLQNASQGLHRLKYAPAGWEKSKFQVIRDEKWKGLFRKITVNELTFHKDSRDYIRDVYENQGINAEIKFQVYRLNFTTQSYVLFFEGKVDLSTYKIDETGVKVQIIDDTFTEKIRKRENQKVNIKGNTSVGGFTTTDIYDANTQVVNFDAVTIQASAYWRVYTPDSTNAKNHYIPIEELNTEFTETQSQTITGTDPMFTASTADRTIRVSGTIDGLVDCNELAPSVSVQVRLKVDGVVQATLLTVNGSDVYQLAFNGTFDETVTVNTGQVMSIETFIGGAVADPTTIYYICDIAISDDYLAIDAGFCQAMPFYEAFLKVCQLIGDKDDALYSDFFGRTDTPIRTYLQDGQLGHLTRGLMIRRGNGLNDTIAISLTDLFSSLSAVFCLGMGIKTISGVDVVEVASLFDFFDNTVILDLSQVVREENIGKEVLPTWHYSRVKSGYNSYEYNTAQRQGTLAEFNTKSEFATPIYAVDNELDIVSKFRADYNGIWLMRQTVGGDSEKGDEDIFLIDTVRDGAGFKARTSEGFDYAIGGVDADQSYNLDWTPARNLMRWGRVIRAGCEHFLNQYLRWQTTDKNSTLLSKLTSETVPVDEDGDILINNLTVPYWYAEAYTVECEFTDDDLDAVLTNPKGLIKLAAGKYGWILELEAGNEEGKTNMRLLRCNTNYVTPLEA